MRKRRRGRRKQGNRRRGSRRRRRERRERDRVRVKERERASVNASGSMSASVSPRARASASGPEWGARGTKAAWAAGGGAAAGATTPKGGRIAAIEEPREASSLSDPKRDERRASRIEIKKGIKKKKAYGMAFIITTSRGRAFSAARARSWACIFASPSLSAP